MTRPVRPALAGLAAAALVLTGGCSVLGGGGGAAPSTAPAPDQTAASAPADPTSAPASPTAAQPTPADPDASAGSTGLGDPSATRTSAIDDAKITLQLYPLQREGSVSHLNFTLSSPVESTEGQVASTLGDGNGKVGDSTYDTADGIQLVDGKNAKLYLVASDGNGTCLCSRGLSDVFLKADVPQLFSATFAAPPADVTTVDVKVPGFGTVKGVPVQ